jgi:hypothetical protein
MGILVRQEQIDTTEFSISSFTNDVGIVEVGSTVDDVNLSWSYNKSISSQSINQGIGSLDTALRTYALSGLGLTTTTTYTLTANGIPTGSDSDSTSVSFRYKKFYGKDSDAGPLSDADIKALDNSGFATSRATSFNITCSAEYIYISYPKSWGAASFKVNGLDNTAWTLTDASFTNDAGSTYDAYTYRSDNILTGTFDIEVL